MAKEKQQISVIERNQQYNERLRKLLEAGDVFQPISSEVRIKDNSEWRLLWANSEIRDGMALQEAKLAGYIYVEPDELVTPVADFGASVSPEHRVVRGPRGADVLMKVPMWYHRERDKKKSQRNHEITFNKGKVADAMLNAVGTEHGSEAAEFVKRAGIEIQDARERVALDE